MAVEPAVHRGQNDGMRRVGAHVVQLKETTTGTTQKKNIKHAHRHTHVLEYTRTARATDTLLMREGDREQKKDKWCMWLTNEHRSKLPTIFTVFCNKCKHSSKLFSVEEVNASIYREKLKLARGYRKRSRCPSRPYHSPGSAIR